MMLQPHRLPHLRGRVEAYMQDTCVIVSVSEGVRDSYGNPTSASTETTSKCLLEWRPSVAIGEQQTSGIAFSVEGVEVRLPHGTVIDASDRVRITHLKGEALDAPLVFEVKAVPELRDLETRVRLERIS